MKFEIIDVSCYSGYKLNEKPLSFRLRGTEYRIIEVIDRWYEGNASSAMQCINYFRVRTEDGMEYIIRYNELFDKWTLLIAEHDKDKKIGATQKKLD
ncbi:MAG: cytoplasmic protein [Proteobacteria bacterium]|nr:cytoplasmic protein [Pseudomonadota bacterium]